ncbi:MAG: GAF domain-containing protein [Chloroflexi bacterium]|nr:GAF domain-containing protein [Chloroflexota bacterium]
MAYGLALVLIIFASFPWPFQNGSYFLLVIPISLAGLLIDWRKGYILAVFGILGGLAIILAEEILNIPNSTDGLLFSSWLAGCTSFVVVTVIARIIARKNEIQTRLRLQANLDHTTERLEILHKIYRAILENDSPEDIAQAALAQIDDLLPFQRASIVTFDFDANEAKVIAVQSDVQIEPKPGVIFTIQEYGIAPELMAGKIRLVKNAQTLDEAQAPGDVLKSMDVMSFASIPLMVENKLVGALNMAALPESVLTPDHLDMASEIADTIAIAIQDARLQEKIRQSEQQLFGLYQTALAINNQLDISMLVKQVFLQVKQMIDPDAFVFMQVDRDQNTLRILLSAEGKEDDEFEFDGRIPLDESSLSGWVVQEKSALLITNMDSDSLPVKPKHGAKPAKSWLGVPLLADNMAVGVMSIQSYTYNAFNQDDRRLLESLGALVAIAMRNAELFSEMTHQLDHIQALHDIDMAITSNEEIGTVSGKVLDQAISQLEADAATLLVWNPVLNTLNSTARRGFRTSQSTAPFARLDDYITEGLLGRHDILAIPDLMHKNKAVNVPLNEDFQAYFSAPLFAKGEFLGLLEIYHRHPHYPNASWVTFLENLAGQAAIAIHNSNLIQHLQNKNLELSVAYDTTLEGWAKALELRDMETEGHSRRVTDLSTRLAKRLGVPETEIVHLRRGAWLHDIGKIGIPDNILRKPGPLDETEWKIMRRHPELARQFLSSIPYLQQAISVPYSHHEKWDGSGYPLGLKGEEIPLQVRIFSIIDVWDALSSDRPYRKAWTKEKALQYIEEQSGHSFDPNVVLVFLNLCQEEPEIVFGHFSE